MSLNIAFLSYEMMDSDEVIPKSKYLNMGL